MADDDRGDDAEGAGDQAAGGAAEAAAGGGSGRRAAVRRRRRSNVTGGRSTVRTEVKLSEDEAAILVARAEDQGVSLPRLLVEAALTPAGETPTERRNAITELFALHRTLAGVANNLNQLAKHANADGVFPERAFDLGVRTFELCLRIDQLITAIADGRLLPVQSPVATGSGDPARAGDEDDLTDHGQNEWGEALQGPLAGTDWGQ